MSVIISYKAGSNVDTLPSNMDFKVHPVSKAVDFQTLKEVVKLFVDSANTSFSVDEATLKEGQLKKLPDGFLFSTIQTETVIEVSQKYSRPGKIYGKTHKSKPIRLFVIVTPSADSVATKEVDEVVTVEEEKPQKVEQTKEENKQEAELTIEEKRDASFRLMLDELSQKIKEREERKQQLLLCKEFDQTFGDEQTQEIDNSVSYDEDVQQSFEEDPANLFFFDREKTADLDKLIEEGWKVYTNPTFQQDPPSYDTLPKFNPLQRADGTFAWTPCVDQTVYDKSVNEDEDEDESSSSDDDVYYIPKRRRHVHWEDEESTVEEYIYPRQRFYPSEPWPTPKTPCNSADIENEDEADETTESISYSSWDDSAEEPKAQFFSFAPVRETERYQERACEEMFYVPRYDYGIFSHAAEEQGFCYDASLLEPLLQTSPTYEESSSDFSGATPMAPKPQLYFSSHRW